MSGINQSRQKARIMRYPALIVLYNDDTHCEYVDVVEDGTLLVSGRDMRTIFKICYAPNGKYTEVYPNVEIFNKGVTNETKI
jgi:hypothetical protein